MPQDVPGLIDAMGRDRFVKQLNDGFEKSAPQRFNGGGRSAVYHGNEPSMHMAWLFNWAGKPWLTQKWVRRSSIGITATLPMTFIWATKTRAR